jgi:hypothetical protein
MGISRLRYCPQTSIYYKCFLLVEFLYFTFQIFVGILGQKLKFDK